MVEGSRIPDYMGFQGGFREGLRDLAAAVLRIAVDLWPLATSPASRYH
jgi:hypothetical protein